MRGTPSTITLSVRDKDGEPVTRDVPATVYGPLAINRSLNGDGSRYTVTQVKSGLRVLPDVRLQRTARAIIEQLLATDIPWGDLTPGMGGETIVRAAQVVRDTWAQYQGN